MKTFMHPLLNEPDVNATRCIVSSVRVETLGELHDRVTIYNRGANAGHIFVKAGDGETIAQRLLGSI